MKPLSINKNKRNVLFASIALLTFISHLVLFLKGGEEYIVANLTIDDSFYYFEIAWNHKLQGFVTFDMVHKTNGIQLLLYYFFYLISFISSNKHQFLVNSYFFIITLNSLCVFLFSKLGSKILRQYEMLFLGVAFFLFFPFRYNIILMENTPMYLLSILFIGYFYDFLQNLFNSRVIKDSNIIGLLILSYLLILTRIDSIIIVTFLDSLVFLLIFWMTDYEMKFKIKKLSLYIISYTVSILSIPIIFSCISDTFLPISGIAKLYVAKHNIYSTLTKPGLYNPRVYDLVTKINHWFYMTIFKGYQPLMLANYQIIISVVLGLLFTYYFFSELVKWIKIKSIAINSMLSIILIAAVSVHLLYFLLITTVEYFSWYCSITKVFFYVTSILIITEYIKKNVQFFACTIFLLSGIYLFYQDYVESKKSYNSNTYVARYKLGKYINDKFPKNVVFAGWNSGQLSYFSERRFVNLDGVVNNNEYFSNYIKINNPISKYLIQEKVDYIVDYRDYTIDEITKNCIPVFHLPIDIANKREMTIWKFDKEYFQKNPKGTYY